MSKITIKSEIDVKSLLAEIANLKVKELETFLRELSGIVTRKKAKDKKYQAAALLQKHNETVLNKPKRNRYAALYEKLEADIITEDERKEFLKLTKEEEQLRNKRVKILIQIAQIRAISFNQLLKELGLKPIRNGRWTNL